MNGVKVLLLLPVVTFLAGCTSTAEMASHQDKVSPRQWCQGGGMSSRRADPTKQDSYRVQSRCERALIQSKRERSQREAEKEAERIRQESLQKAVRDWYQPSMGASEGDGSSDDRECQTLGFRPGTKSYYICRYGDEEQYNATK